MQASGGVHAAPKWKQLPAPLDRQVKYAPTPAWKTQVGDGQPTSRAWTAALAPPALAPGRDDETGVVAEPWPLGPRGAPPDGWPQPSINPTVNVTAWRTTRL